MLDLWQQDQDVASRPQPNEGRDLPATFGETFDAAWSEGRLFSDNLAHYNARSKAIDDYIAEVKGAGGNVDVELANKQNISGEYTDDDRLEAANAAASKVKVNPLSDDDLERRMVAEAAKARQNYAQMAGREKTFGGKVGMVLGGLAAGATDPINLVAIPVAPELEATVFGSAVLWGTYGLISQGINEGVNAQFREQAQPGYGASSEPTSNILGAAAFGAVGGAGLKVLGNLAGRLKGEVPRAAQDAGNIVESEANIQGSNVLPGPEGEAAHRESMATAINQILGGLPVDVAAASRQLVSRLEREVPFQLPTMNEQAIRLLSEEAGLRDRQAAIVGELGHLPQGDLSAADRLNRLQAVDQQIAGTTDAAAKRALNARRDQILVDTTPEALRAAASPIEQRRALETENNQIEARLNDIATQRAEFTPQPPTLVSVPPRLFDVHMNRIDGLMNMRAKIGEIAAQASEERAASTATGELPFTATGLDSVHNMHIGLMGQGLRELGLIGGHDMGMEEARELALRVTRARTDDEARGIIQSVTDRPRTLLETLPSPADFAKARKDAELLAQEPPVHTVKEMQETLASPQHEAALRADIDRTRAVGDVKIPSGVDANGEPVYRSLDSAMTEIDHYNEIAQQVQACAAPQAEAEAA